LNNPGIQSLGKFLLVIKKQQPTTRQRISNALNRAYGMVNEYLKFCSKTSLIQISKIENNRGPWPQKYYVLTPTGEILVKVLGEIRNERAR